MNGLCQADEMLEDSGRRRAGIEPRPGQTAGRQQPAQPDVRGRRSRVDFQKCGVLPCHIPDEIDTDKSTQARNRLDRRLKSFHIAPESAGIVPPRYSNRASWTRMC